VVASVDTYLHFAEAANRLDLRGQGERHDTDLQSLTTGMSEEKTEGILEGGKNKLKETFGRSSEAEDSAQKKS
jgi:gas vesicle structural protein